VVGTATAFVATMYREEKVGDVTQIRGGVVTYRYTMNDPRATGRGEFAFSIDAYSIAGSQWGTQHLENEDGAWEGPCSGGSWDEGNHLLMSCWLVGSGGYAGYTYYQVHQPGGNVEGIIYPGSPPAP
jgi:hypothetical protein